MDRASGGGHTILFYEIIFYCLKLYIILSFFVQYVFPRAFFHVQYRVSLDTFPHSGMITFMYKSPGGSLESMPPILRNERALIREGV